MELHHSANIFFWNCDSSNTSKNNLHSPKQSAKPAVMGNPIYPLINYSLRKLLFWCVLADMQRQPVYSRVAKEIGVGLLFKETTVLYN